MSQFIVHQLNQNFFTSQPISANISSASQNINGYSLYAVQHIWSGASGTWIVIIEGSNNDSDYTVIDTSSITSSSGTRMVNVEKAGYAFVRCRVAYTSGGGTLTSIINGKIL